MRRKNPNDLLRENASVARKIWGELPTTTMKALQELSLTHHLRVSTGELLLLDRRWYVTHSGLLGIARRKHCHGIHVQALLDVCDPGRRCWVFKASVFRSATCHGFSGFGDANPSNVSSQVIGAELRIAETRAVNRALRKAYGIGICSVEELGASVNGRCGELPKCPARSVAANGNNGHHAAPRVRDRLCQLIRSHNLDAGLVKSYAVSFCGTKTLREATREQVEAFVAHLADWAQKDRNALLCQLNSSQRPQAGAA
jgi:hypothetical protein